MDLNPLPGILDTPLDLPYSVYRGQALTCDRFVRLSGLGLPIEAYYDLRMFILCGLD